jgi:hypothetical protein
MGEPAARLLTLAATQCRHEHDLGDKMAPWSFQGYKGFAAGNWRYGNGGQGAIAVVSGEQAQISASTLARLAQHWSRVDYCVTVLFDDWTEDPASVYWEAFRGNEAKNPHNTAVTRIQRTDGGATVAVGERSSAAYIRVYNKHAESPREYVRGSWRFEVEYKRYLSEGEQRAFFRAGAPHDPALSLVRRDLLAYALPVPWTADAPVDRTKAPARGRDADRCLDWLSKQVAPTVAFCAEARGRDAVMEALNLSTHVLVERDV